MQIGKGKKQKEKEKKEGIRWKMELDAPRGFATTVHRGCCSKDLALPGQHASPVLGDSPSHSDSQALQMERLTLSLVQERAFDLDPGQDCQFIWSSSAPGLIHGGTHCAYELHSGLSLNCGGRGDTASLHWSCCEDRA